MYVSLALNNIIFILTYTLPIRILGEGKQYNINIEANKLTTNTKYTNLSCDNKK